MRTIRTLTVAVAALSLAAVAAAQFDGPAPLAWRWQSTTNGVPSGAPLYDATSNTVYSAVGGRVFAIDKDTGNTKWRFPAVDPIDGTFRHAPILANGSLLVVGDNKIVYAIDPKSGQSKWSATLPGSPIGNAVTTEQYLVTAQSDNKLVAVDLTDGHLAWNSPYNVFDGFQGQISAYRNDVLYFDGKNQLVSLNTVTLKSTWRQRLSQVQPGAVPVVYHDTVFVNSGVFLIALNASFGNPTWQRATQMPLALSPTVSTDGVFVVSTDGKAMMYDLDAGQPLPAFKKPLDLGSLAAVQPSVVGTKILVPTTKGALELIDPKSGQMLWSFIVRPVGGSIEAESSSSTGSFGTGKGAGFGGQGGPGGKGGPGRGNQNRTNATTEKIYSLQASGSGTLAGNTLLVPAQDGSILAFDKELGVDLTPPSVKMVFPNPGEQVSPAQPLQLMFKIEDDASGIDESTLKADIDGQPYEIKLAKDGYGTITFSSSSKTNKPLSDGKRVITITVSDWMGNQSKMSYTLLIDSALRPVSLPGTETDTNNGGFGGKGRGGLGGGPGGKGGGDR